MTLRLIEPADAPALARAHQKNRAHLAPWDPARGDEFFTEATQRANLLTRLRQHQAGEGLPLVAASGADIVRWQDHTLFQLILHD